MPVRMAVLQPQRGRRFARIDLFGCRLLLPAVDAFRTLPGFRIAGASSARNLQLTAVLGAAVRVIVYKRATLCLSLLLPYAVPGTSVPGTNAYCTLEYVRTGAA